MFFLSFLLLLVPLVASTSRRSVLRMHKAHVRSVDTTPITGQFDSVNTGQYSLLNNLWGEHDATSGSQTSQITSLTGNYIAWTTAYTWTGGPDQVKSFSNIQLNYGINQQLSAISSLPTDWQWSVSNNSAVADVAYDLFTSWSSGGTNVNEIMVWLANINSGPISANYNAQGQAVPIASNISLEGYTWNLYSGFNGVNQVYSFLLTSGTIQSFSGDIYPFLSYLIDNEGMNTAQYLTCAQAGTEAFSGTATFTTYAYSMAIN